jgi:hypothetical protein
MKKPSQPKHTCGPWPDPYWTPEDFKRKTIACKTCPVCNPEQASQEIMKETQEVYKEGSTQFTEKCETCCSGIKCWRCGTICLPDYQPEVEYTAKIHDGDPCKICGETLQDRINARQPPAAEGWRNELDDIYCEDLELPHKFVKIETLIRKTLAEEKKRWEKQDR